MEVPREFLINPGTGMKLLDFERQFYIPLPLFIDLGISGFLNQLVEVSREIRATKVLDMKL